MQSVTSVQFNKYFATMLYAADDLNPYEYRLLGHYITQCTLNNGACVETTRQTAAATKIGLAKVRSTRVAMIQKGYIAAQEISGLTVSVTVVDRNDTPYQMCEGSPEPLSDVAGVTPIESDTPTENDTPPLSDVVGVDETHAHGDLDLNTNTKTPELDSSLSTESSNLPSLVQESNSPATPKKKRKPSKPPIKVGGFVKGENGHFGLVTETGTRFIKIDFFHDGKRIEDQQTERTKVMAVLSRDVPPAERSRLKPPKVRDQVEPYNELLDGFFNVGIGKKHFPLGIPAWSACIPEAKRYVRNGVTKDQMVCAGGFIRTWLEASRAVPQWERGYTIKLMRSALGFCQQGYEPADLKACIEHLRGDRVRELWIGNYYKVAEALPVHFIEYGRGRRAAESGPKMKRLPDPTCETCGGKGHYETDGGTAICTCLAMRPVENTQ